MVTNLKRTSTRTSIVVTIHNPFEYKGVFANFTWRCRLSLPLADIFASLHFPGRRNYDDILFDSSEKKIVRCGRPRLAKTPHQATRTRAILRHVLSEIDRLRNAPTSTGGGDQLTQRFWVPKLPTCDTNPEMYKSLKARRIHVACFYPRIQPCRVSCDCLSRHAFHSSSPFG